MSTEDQKETKFMDREIFGIKIRYWLAVLFVPILINVVAWIPDPLAVGNFETWIGFFGNYSGGIVGAFIALLIAKSQTNVAVQQLHQEKERYRTEREQEKAEREVQSRAFADLIKIFLYDEIKINLDRITPDFLVALKTRANNERLDATYISGFKEAPFQYTVFDDLKYEIPKHNNNVINEAIIPYKAFKILEKYSEINKMPLHTARFLFDTIKDWNMKLNADGYNY